MDNAWQRHPRDRVKKVPSDGQGRMRADALTAALAAGSGPAIVCAQAGNVNTGALDPLLPIVAAAREAGAWVHVDGAFGLWAAASPSAICRPIRTTSAVSRGPVRSMRCWRTSIASCRPPHDGRVQRRSASCGTEARTAGSWLAFTSNALSQMGGTRFTSSA